MVKRDIIGRRPHRELPGVAIYSDGREREERRQDLTKL
jgi:hypothetical protein